MRFEIIRPPVIIDAYAIVSIATIENETGGFLVEIDNGDRIVLSNEILNQLQRDDNSCKMLPYTAKTGDYLTKYLYHGASAANYENWRMIPKEQFDKEHLAYKE